ncbi:MAG TPA: hypothetical protein VFO60_09195 [Candidatus Dormibacteraeota bacterium]|nr:hypothetical protein [Candidatus Dormibacteraeota bacterium]
MHRHRRLAATIVLGAAGLIGMTGCGSSSSSSSSSSSAAESSSGAGGNGSSSSSSASIPTVSIPGGGSGFCQQAASAIAQLNHLNAGLLGAGTTIDSVKQLFAADASVIDSLDNAAPSEIASDAHVVRAAFDQTNSNVQAAKTLQDLSTAVSPFEAPAVKTASDNLNAYGRTTCGITSSST